MVVICVDDSNMFVSALKRRTQSILPDAQIYTFLDPEQALKQAKIAGCDLLLTEIDVGLSNRGGILLAKYLKEFNPKAKIIFVTVCSAYEHERALRYMEFDGYITKP